MHSACLWQLWVLSLHGFSGSHTWMDNGNGNWISPLLFVRSGSSVRLGSKHVAHEIILNAPHTVPPTVVILLRPRKPAAASHYQRTNFGLDAIPWAHRPESDSRSLIKTVKAELLNSNDTNPFTSNQLGKLGHHFKASCYWSNSKLGRSWIWLNASLKCDIKRSKV